MYPTAYQRFQLWGVWNGSSFDLSFCWSCESHGSCVEADLPGGYGVKSVFEDLVVNIRQVSVILLHWLNMAIGGHLRLTCCHLVFLFY
jgi:hypothetical protein